MDNCLDLMPNRTAVSSRTANELALMNQELDVAINSSSIFLLAPQMSTNMHGTKTLLLWVSGVLPSQMKIWRLGTTSFGLLLKTKQNADDPRHRSAPLVLTNAASEPSAQLCPDDYQSHFA